MKNLIGLKELRQNTENYVRRVGRGESFVVVRKNQPLFRLSPIDEDSAWETFIDFTKVKKGGVDLEDLLSRL